MGRKKYSLHEIGLGRLTIEHKAAWSKAVFSLDDRELDRVDYLPDLGEGLEYQLPNSHILRIGFRGAKAGIPQGITVDVDGRPHLNSVTHPTYVIRSIGAIFYFLATLRFIAAVFYFGSAIFANEPQSLDAPVTTGVIVLGLAIAYFFSGRGARRGHASAFWTGVAILATEVAIMVVQNLPGTLFTGTILAAVLGVGITDIIQSRRRKTD